MKDVESPHIFTSSLNVTSVFLAFAACLYKAEGLILLYSVVDAGTSHGTEIRKVSTLDQVVAETIGLGN